MSEEGNEQEQRGQQEEDSSSEIIQHLVNGEDEWSSEDDVASNPDNTEESGGYILLSQNLSDEDNDNQLTPFPNSQLIDSYPKPTDSNPIPDLPENESSSVECTQQVLMEEADVIAVQEAMVGFSLPLSVVPNWAQNLPEDVWKKELLEGIRKQRRPDNH